MIDVSSILVNDVIDKFCSNSASPFVTDTESILTNDEIENIDSILASSFETYALTNSGLSTPLLFPFSNTLLPFAFNCVTSCSSIKFISYPSVLYLRFPISPIISKYFPQNMLSLRNIFNFSFQRIFWYEFSQSKFYHRIIP